ncbi:Anaerobic sulfite reductase subunit C [Chitinispirillum alkaliphilum]|nr:Anaerobic sulfite reductase subunit C [Chitinispirillum alkaliphilum]
MRRSVSGAGSVYYHAPQVHGQENQKISSGCDMGRTGKKNPRLAQPFLNWVSEETVLKVIENMYTYIDHFIDKTLVKEHVDYIVDRTGYPVFRDWVLRDVELNKEAKVAKPYQLDRVQIRFRKQSSLMYEIIL